MHIGVLGGTGPAGRGIATRLAATGHRVMLGSRDRERAAEVVADLRERWGDRVATLEPGSNHDAADADLVVLATVWDAAVPTAAAHADQLAGKVVVSMANGLRKEGRQFVPVVTPHGSIAAEVQSVAPGAQVVAAFHLVPAAALADISRPLVGDVLVVGDDDGRPAVLDLIDGIADLRALDAGPLANTLGIEAFSAALLTVNLRHKGEGSLRIEGIGPTRVHHMTIEIFDTAQRAIVPFEVGPVVRMYVCGITPYDSTHLGHAATYLTYDLLIRRLEELGHDVRMVRNVTDVDDSILPKARELGVPYLDLAEAELARFRSDMDALGTRPPLAEPRATESIDGMVEMVNRLLDDGHAYLTHGTVYFDVSTFPRFGEVSHYPREDMVRLARTRGQPR